MFRVWLLTLQSILQLDQLCHAEAQPCKVLSSFTSCWSLLKYLMKCFTSSGAGHWLRSAELKFKIPLTFSLLNKWNTAIKPNCLGQARSQMRGNNIRLSTWKVNSMGFACLCAVFFSWSCFLLTKYATKPVILRAESLEGGSELILKKKAIMSHICGFTLC